MDSKATQSYTYVRPFSPKPLPSVLPLSVERRPLRFGVGPCSVSPGLNFVDERVSVVSTSAARGLRCRARAALWLGARTARRGGFSRRRARARRARRAPSLRPRGLSSGFADFRAQAGWLWARLSYSEQVVSSWTRGADKVSSASRGGFLTTRLPGKPCRFKMQRRPTPVS